MWGYWLGWHPAQLLLLFPLPSLPQGCPWLAQSSPLPSHLDLHLMPLLRLLHLPVLVPQLCSLLLQLPAGDLPEGVNLVTLQLEIVALFPFPVQLLPETRNVLLQLQSQGEEPGGGKRGPRTDASARWPWQAVSQTWQDTVAVTGMEKCRREGEETWTLQNPSASGKGVTKPYPSVSSRHSDILSRSVR